MPTKSLNLFLSKLIDYAGLFPPANLDLIPALNNYRKYIDCEDSWMMSQFIIPLNDLKNISVKDMELFDDSFPLDLSILSGNLANDIEKLNSFKNLYPNKVKFSGLETRISNLDELLDLLTSTNSTIKNNNLNLSSFFELPYCENWLVKMENAINTISKFNKLNQTNFGFKLRCGGIKADMFPEPSFVSNAILSCIKNEVPMKFTAGLHHPVRHFNDSVNTKMYGFFNIFIGGMLAQKFNLNFNQLVEILTDEDEANFIFNEDEFRWKNYKIKNEEIEQYRSKNFISYGSCSFDEPREDLTNLGIF